MKRKLIALGSATLLAALAISASRIVFPRIDPPAATDATLILASPGGTAVIRDDRLDDYPGAKVVSAPAGLAELPEYRALCARADVTCFIPDPLTTSGEARGFGALARAHGWTSVTVVTHRSHLTRARMLVSRCFPGQVRMSVEDTEHGLDWLGSLTYETGAIMKAVVPTGCS